LPEVWNVSIDVDAIAAESNVAVKDGVSSAEHSDRRDSITPIPGSGKVAEIAAGSPTLLTAFIVAPLIHAYARIISVECRRTVAKPSGVVIENDAEGLDLIAPRLRSGKITQPQIANI
jgi:hypothetical protein